MHEICSLCLTDWRTHLWCLESPRPVCVLTEYRPRRAEGAEEAQRKSGWEFHLAPGSRFFVLFRSSTDWMRPTHIMEGNLPYPKFTNLNVNLIHKHSPSWHLKLTIILEMAVQSLYFLLKLGKMRKKNALYELWAYRCHSITVPLITATLEDLTKVWASSARIRCICEGRKRFAKKKKSNFLVMPKQLWLLFLADKGIIY